MVFMLLGKDLDFVDSNSEAPSDFHIHSVSANMWGLNLDHSNGLFFVLLSNWLMDR